SSKACSAVASCNTFNSNNNCELDNTLCRMIAVASKMRRGVDCIKRQAKRSQRK
ncbi:hypothetical protein NDU88_005045, partial [Pleurodeles waltl]